MNGSPIFHTVILMQQAMLKQGIESGTFHSKTSVKSTAHSSGKIRGSW